MAILLLEVVVFRCDLKQGRYIVNLSILVVSTKFSHKALSSQSYYKQNKYLVIIKFFAFLHSITYYLHEAGFVQSTIRKEKVW